MLKPQRHPMPQSGDQNLDQRPVPHHQMCFNEMPVGPSDEVLGVVLDAARMAHRYPLPAATELTKALASEHHVSPDRLVVGAGTAALALMVTGLTACGGGEVVFAVPGVEHLIGVAASLVGAHAVEVPLRDHVHDLDAMADAVSPRTRLIIVCNPHNPTGTVVSKPALGRFLDRVPDDVLIVLDEAYWEFTSTDRTASGLDVAEGRPNVCVFRTFSKAHALAGLRVGYVIAPASVAQRLHTFTILLGANALAQAAAQASLMEARTAVQARVSATLAERERLRHGLAGLGWSIPASQANFLWVPLAATAEDFTKACADAGIEVRCFPGRGVRITVGEPTANDALLQAAARFAVTARSDRASR